MRFHLVPEDRTSGLAVKERTNKKYTLPGVVIPDSIQATTDRKEAVDGADIVILAGPSRAVAQTVRDFAPYLKTWQILVNVAKGWSRNTVPAFGCHQKRSAQCEVCVLSGTESCRGGCAKGADRLF
ncbi:MAG: hypothetical protein V8Q32_01560 [Anaerotignum faecicola]